MSHANTSASRKDLRSFGLIMAGMIAFWFGLLLPWVFGAAWPQWPWYAAGVFLVLAVVMPVSLRPVYVVWMRIGAVLGWINTRIILGLVFYLMFTPISLFFALKGRDAMARKLDDDMESYRVPSKAGKAEDFEHPY